MITEVEDGNEEDHVGSILMDGEGKEDVVHKKREKEDFGCFGRCCRFLKEVNCIFFITVNVAIFSSVVIGFGIAELNSAEYFVPYFDGGNAYNNTVSFNEGDFERTCGNMKKWFKDCIPMRSELTWNYFVTVFAVGGIFGSLATPVVEIPIIGRKWTIWVTAFLHIIACSLKIVFSNSWTFFFGRALHGFLAGLSSAVVPMYIVEIAPASISSFFGAYHQIGITFGIFLSQILSYSLTSQEGNEKGNQMWRLVFGSTVCLSVLQLLILPCLPSSPEFLAWKGDFKGARRSLRLLRRIRGDEFEEEYNSLIRTSGMPRKLGQDEPEKRRILDSNKSTENKHTPPLPKMKLCSRTTLCNLTIAILMQVFQQVSGINAIMFYSTLIYSTALFTDRSGYSLIAPRLSLVTMFINFVSVIPSMCVISVLGRKSTLLVGIFVQILALSGVTLFLVVMAYGFDNEGAGGTVFGILSVFCMNIFIVFYELSLGPIPWFIVSGLFTINLRSYAVGFSISVNWLFTFLVGLVFPFMQLYMQMFSFLIFSTFMVVAWCFILCNGNKRSRRRSEKRMKNRSIN